MMIELEKMSRKELEAHLKDVHKALRDAERREKTEARKAAEKAAAEFGFSLSEVFEGAASPERKTGGKTVSAPRYRNPENPDQTWTGRGRRPAWFAQAVEKGIDPKDMEI